MRPASSKNIPQFTTLKQLADTVSGTGILQRALLGANLESLRADSSYGWRLRSYLGFETQKEEASFVKGLSLYANRIKVLPRTVNAKVAKVEFSLMAHPDDISTVIASLKLVAESKGLLAGVLPPQRPRTPSPGYAKRYYGSTRIIRPGYFHWYTSRTRIGPQRNILHKPEPPPGNVITLKRGE